MKEVTAYEGSRGHLHKTKNEAIESDFISMVQGAWGQMPDQRDRGDPVVIARILASETYQSSKVHLRDAIAWLDRQKGFTKSHSLLYITHRGKLMAIIKILAVIPPLLALSFLGGIWLSWYLRGAGTFWWYLYVSYWPWP